MPNMAPVSLQELLSIQADAIAAVCDKPCAIFRKANITKDPYGSQTTDYEQIEETVCGMSQPSAGHLANYDFLIASEASYLVHLPIGTDVAHQDHLLVNGQVLEVHVILTPQSYQALLQIIAAEIK